MAALLEIDRLAVAYGDIRAVDGVTLSVEAGELVTVIGVNGAGKTSILNAVMGLVPPAAGSISFDGRRLDALPAHARAHAGLRLVPERSRVFPRLTVAENLLTGVYRRRRQVPLQERLQRLHELFPILKERANQQARTLSGGEQQQLAIARALIADPKLLLVDEVSMGLMPKLVDQVFELLLRLNRDQGLSILLVEQNALASLEIAHRAYVLETGSVALAGPAGELIKDSRIRKTYLGLADSDPSPTEPGPGPADPAPGRG